MTHNNESSTFFVFKEDLCVLTCLTFIYLAKRRYCKINENTQMMYDVYREIL